MDIDQKNDGQHQKAKEIHRKTTINLKTNEKQRKTDEQLIEINAHHRKKNTGTFENQGKT